MAKRRKHRTHLRGETTAVASGKTGDPKSFIVKHGQVGASISQLVRDFRKVMEPNTAARLQERNRNKLKDYLTIAPALGVTHLLAFTLTDLAPSMRIVRLPAGPTLSFRIERYSLMKDLLKTVKRARSIGMEYLSAPLLVMASFPPPGPTTPPHLSLLQKTFQSLFPPLSPKTIALSSARRVVLVSYDSERGTINIRHYIITIKPYGVSRKVRKVLEGAIPSTSKTKSKKSTSGSGFLDLGNEKDVADFLLRKRGETGPDGGGYESAASSAESVMGDEADTVSLADDYVGRNNKKGSKRAIKLDEVGPRLELRLIKVTEGTPAKPGAVIFHQFVKKTKKELSELNATHAEKERLRKERREEQERNVARKKAALNTKTGAGGDNEDEDEESVNDPERSEASDDQEEEELEEDGAWDDEEEISDDEDTDEPDSEAGESSESDDEERVRPTKKAKTRSKR